ncbi:MAG: SH3 domain-containing protein [Syntrophomonadaceae bacterium]|nr:SH3 domain-containing protein [Syntrophomonadaceae bacterium]
MLPHTQPRHSLSPLPVLYAVAVLTFTLVFLILVAGAAQAATGTITGSVVNIRGGPGTSYTKVGSITKGARVEVIKQSGGWYQIRFAGNRTGWVAGSLISVKSTASAATSTPSRALTSPGVKVVQVTGSLVNLREGPGTTYPIIGKVTRGTVLTVVGTKNQWYEVLSPASPRGYISAGLVKAVAYTAAKPGTSTTSTANTAAASSGQTAVVKGSIVNIRSGPGTSYARLGQVKQGDRLQVLGSASGWYKVKTVSGQQGWIAGSLVTVSQNAGTKPSNQSPAEPQTPTNSSSPSAGTPRVEPTTPSRGGGIDRGDEPQPEPSEPPQPEVIQEGTLEGISEIVLGNIQVISIETSVPAGYEAQKGDSSYALTLKGMRRGSLSEVITLAGKGATQIRLTENPDPIPSTTLTFNAFGNCIYGITPSGEGKTIKLFIKTDLLQERTGQVTVVLDAGHGGRDPGAIGPAGTFEKNINLPIALETGRLLAEQNIKVVYTRADDTYLTLPERSQVANSAGADLFVSIHCNGSTNPEKQGTSTYYYAPASNPVLAAQEQQRRELATCIQNALLQELGRMDMGVRQGNFAVLRETVIPCALVETLFITNPTEEQLLCQADIQQRAASAIAKGIKEFLNILGRL